MAESVETVNPGMMPPGFARDLARKLAEEDDHPGISIELDQWAIVQVTHYLTKDQLAMLHVIDERAE